MKKYILLYLFILLLCSFCHAQDNSAATLRKGPNYSTTIQKEKLSRGLMAIRNRKGQVVVSWRFLPSDDIDAAFDVYRKVHGKKEKKLNSKPVINSTFLLDSTADINKDLSYILYVAGSKNKIAEYTLTSEKAKLPYLTIPLKSIPKDSMWRYSPNDVAVGDLDGDGDMEIILKRENSGKDNSFRGVCDGGPVLEAYELDGTFLWRIYLGINIRQGAHYTQMMVYDFDGDGKSELAVKTAEGTLFGDGKIIGDVNEDGITDYVDRDPSSRTYGKIMTGPEFFSVIEGATGKELARADYIPRGAPDEFGDTHGNRVDRFLGGVGYFDGERPSILICRGYYAKTVLEAWDYREGKLTRKWHFSTTDDNGKYKDYAGQGNHNLCIGDVDGDGRDEVTYGACMIDDDGTGAYTTKLGHGDAIHLTDIDIERPGLEIWDCHEDVPIRAGSELRDACTGELIWGIPSYEDVGRAMAADIDPRFKGCEVWTTHSFGVYTANGEFISGNTPSINNGIWWDGDLNRELLDGSGVTGKEFVQITKWNGDGVDTFTLPGENELAANNWTKGNPCLYGDIVGDWREEVLVRTKDNRELRLYMTDIPTEYRFYTLLNDVIYRNSLCFQNIGYNQPTHPGFYLGSDLGKFWNNEYKLKSGGHSKSGRAEDGKPNGMNERYLGAERIVLDTIHCEGDEYILDAGYDYDQYHWIVNGNPIESARKLVLKRADFVEKKNIQVRIAVTYKGFVFTDSVTVVFE